MEAPEAKEGMARDAPQRRIKKIMGPYVRCTDEAMGAPGVMNPVVQFLGMPDKLRMGTRRVERAVCQALSRGSGTGFGLGDVRIIS